MAHKVSFVALTMAFFLFWSCSDDEQPQEIPSNPNNPNQTPSWLINSNEVKNGGPGKDGIPSIDNPVFQPASEITYMRNEDLILALKVNNTIRGYTHPVLDWHEIVNDQVSDLSLALTYCPLTGTGVAWNSKVDGVPTNFGVSGLLYRNNLMPYDRNSESTWSQMRLDCVNGNLIGTQIETYHIVETSWATWKKMFPNEPTLSLNTGFARDYGRYPYGDYRTNDNFILFQPLVNPDDILPAKERVFGVPSTDRSDWKVYPFSAFGDELSVIKDEFGGKTLLLVGGTNDNLIIGFELTGDQNGLEFDVLPIDEGGVILIDQEGNRWNIFGQASGGPRDGDQLESADGFMGYWFAFSEFYRVDVY